MRTIYRIARLELSTLFYSPVAWLVLMVFSIQSGLYFHKMMEAQVVQQELGRPLSSLTFYIFVEPMRQGLFYFMKSQLYLYIPLLTMGLMSREISSGSVKLLLSSPVKIPGIILGKFVAMMVYGLLLIGILLLMVLTGGVSIYSLDYGLLASGLAGLYLLICAYAAIGLFMSCLTSYQVVAAITTLVVLGLLNYIGLLWQDIDLLRDVAWFLSIGGRTENMIRGLISSKDVFYFIIVIILFLAFSILKLQSGRASWSWWALSVRYVFLITGAVALGLLFSLPSVTVYVDATATKERTLTPASQQVIGSLKDPLTITTYLNLLDQNSYSGLPKNRKEDIASFDLYRRFLPEIQMKYVYYYDTAQNPYLYNSNPGLYGRALALKIAKSRRLDIDMFISPDSIRKIIDLSAEENRTVRVLESGGRKTFLRFFADTYIIPHEPEITAALQRIITGPVKVAFLSDDYERSIERDGDKEYGKFVKELNFRQALVNHGFDVISLSLKEKEIPKDISILVIADPKRVPAPEALQKIQQYISQGGNLLLAAEPDRAAIVNLIAAPLGVHCMEGTLIQEKNGQTPGFVYTSITSAAGKASKGYELIRTNKKAFEHEAEVAMPGVAGLAFDTESGFKMTPVLTTNVANTWISDRRRTTDSGSVFFSGEAGDKKVEVPTAMQLTRTIGNREQRIMILGDADFMSNAEINRFKPYRSTPLTANIAFCMETFHWLSNNRYPVDVTRMENKDTQMLIGHRGLTVIKTLFAIVFPAMLLLFSTILLLRRKRQ